MSRPPTGRRRYLAGVVGALGLAGCLGNPWAPTDEESDSGTANDTEETETPDSTETETTDDEADQPDNPSTAGGVVDSDIEPDHIVAVAPDGFLFSPSSLEIESGDVVRWEWADGGHNLRVRSKPEGAKWEGTPGDASDTYPEGYEHAARFETPGEYVYFCAPHQTLGLEGSITVTD